jgi:hypothetical protein
VTPASLLPLASLNDGFSSSTLQTFFLIVMIVVAGYLFLRSQRYFARHRDDAAFADRPATPSSERQSTAAPQEMARWEVEMHDTARQLSGQLDSKLSALGHLIREADRAAARLEAALSATRSSTLECGGSPPLSVPPDAGGASARADAGEEPPANQARALQAGGVAGEPAEPPAGAAPPLATPRPPADHRYEEIYLLADYGFDPAEISRRVNMPMGEIQLILSLRAKR